MRTVALAAGLAVVAVMADPSGAIAAPDFGDAPDGRPAAYIGKRVTGKFPSLAAKSGPSHAAAGPSLGRWTGERDSRQVNRDADDGAQVEPRSCAESTLTLTVDASRVPPGVPVRVNAWFDYNQDGDWADGGSASCGPEWGVQNVVVDPASLGPGRIGLVTLRFRGGRVPKQFWWRVQIHRGDPVPHLGGASRATAGGETEDWFYDRFERKGPTLGCTPDFWLIAHGRAALIAVELDGAGDGLRVTDVRERFEGPSDGLAVRRLVNTDRFWRYEIRSREHDRVNPFQVVVFHVVVEADRGGRTFVFRTACVVYVVHKRRFELPPHTPEVLTPAPTLQLNPNRPDPVAALCAAHYVGAPPNATLSVRCDGADVRSINVDAGSTDQKIKDFDVRTSPGGCARANGGRSLQCYPPFPSRRRAFSVAYSTDKPFTRTRVFVRAGGTGTGNTIVLLQDIFLTNAGQTCRQQVPRADTCADFDPALGARR